MGPGRRAGLPGGASAAALEPALPAGLVAGFNALNAPSPRLMNRKSLRLGRSGGKARRAIPTRSAPLKKEDH
jgi:hypothetical protein